jgi:hypothetical protein
MTGHAAGEGWRARSRWPSTSVGGPGTPDRFGIDRRICDLAEGKVPRGGRRVVESLHSRLTDRRALLRESVARGFDTMEEQPLDRLAPVPHQKETYRCDS